MPHARNFPLQENLGLGDIDGATLVQRNSLDGSSLKGINKLCNQ